MRGSQVRDYLARLVRNEERELYAILVQLLVHQMLVLREWTVDLSSFTTS